MDDRRFDQLTRMVGRGASRRAMLKALLGLGGSVLAGGAITDEADARQSGARPAIPPPPPPTTTTTTTVAAPCAAGEELCPNSTLCCPEDACARSGNRAICCDGTGGNGTVVCGLDCCEEELQCCDGECCPDGAVCLARRFPDDPGVEEETCCPVESICAGMGAFAGQGACCTGDTPDCCLRDGEPICIDSASQCCNNEECPDDTLGCDVGICLRGSQMCDLDFICGDGGTCCPAQGDEEAGTCVGDDQCCTSVECDDLTDFANCQIGICNRDVFRCEVISACDNVDYDCCAINDSGACAPVDERTPCALEEGGTGICCTGECADTSLCSCTRNVECDPERCEECLEGRCQNRCEFRPLPNIVCAGNNECVECLVDDDCILGRYCDTETNSCFECKTDDECFECRICDVATGSCIADLEANGAPCEVAEEPDLTCCFGDCMATCQTCASDADCPSCEICDFSSGNGQGHCQPCFFTNSHCCFDDFCVPDGIECCQEDSDCPPQFCSDDFSSIVRYVCEPVSGNGGLCTEVVDQVCEGCASCLDSGAGASCVEGCQGSGVCCVTDRCQPLRTCPFSCTEDVDCPGDCAFCQENGFCGTLDDCEPVTTTTPAPVTTTTTTTRAPTTTTTAAGCSALGESCGDPLPCCVGAGTCLSTGVCGPVAVGDVCPNSTPANCVTGCCTNDICAGQIGFIGCSDSVPCCAGFCINGVCAEGCSAIDDSCNVPEHCCDGGPCVLGTCGCRDAGEVCEVADDCCPSAGVCLSSQICGKLENGAACPGAFACESGHCLNSVCAVPLGESGCSDSIPCCCAGSCEGGICQENPPATIDAAPCVAGTCASLGGLCGQTIDDGCGTPIYCGDCPTTSAPMTCFTEGERCVNDSQCCEGLCRGRGCRDRGTQICQTACAT